MVAWTPGVSDAQLPVYEALEPLWQHISQAPNSSVSSLRRANRTCSKRVDQLVDSLSLDCEAKGGHGELLLCCASAIWKNLQHLKLRARYHEGAELAAKAATLLPGLRRMELTLLHDEAQELSSCLALVSLDLSACWLPSHTLLQLFTLTRLQHLDLSGQHLLTSLAFARHMTGLHALILQGCSGGCTLDLRPLANCSALTSLDLRGSHPRCLEDVPEATLAALQAAASPLPDDQPARPPPAQLSNSEGATDSAATALFTDLPQAPAMSFEPGSLAALAHCPQLQNLRLARCFLTPSLAPLAACTQLRTLDLQMCTALTDLSPLSALPSLTDLDLYGCTELTSIQPLALSAPSLTRLMMAFCHSVPDLSVLSGATRLQQLDVSCCIGVRSLPLQACRNLTHLQMKQLKVPSLAPLAGCPRLRALDARFCTALSDLQPLTACSLHTLLLTGCTGLTDASPLAGCRSLKLLDLAGCTGVRDVTPVLEGCRELVRVEVRGCDPLLAKQLQQAKRTLPRREGKGASPGSRLVKGGSAR